MRIILTLMIKNESLIILRCLQHALPFVDAILISDTGSTDDTCSKVSRYFNTLSIPTYLVHEPWVDFGHNRTRSFISTVEWCTSLGWDLDQTYSLVLDADMILKGTLDKTLGEDGYHIKQISTIEYDNIRLMKLSVPWKCIGVTHEYWDGTSCPLRTLYIEDKEDGGCKKDKYKRDEQLLKKGLQESPNDLRYMFYLAQTLKDKGQSEEAISWYIKRIQGGGWKEEVWYCKYQISCMHARLKQFPEMEYWALKAFEDSPHRAEPIYLLTKTFREKSQPLKAWHYYDVGSRIKKPDGLFVETEVYTRKFEFEKTILNYYIHGDLRPSLYELIQYINVHESSVYVNLRYYVSPIACRMRKLKYPDVDGFHASSISMLPYQHGYVLNIRYVNYTITELGCYKIQGKDVDHEHTIQTRNFKLCTDYDFMPRGSLVEMKGVYNRHRMVQGLEDLRLYEKNGIRWIAVGRRIVESKWCSDEKIACNDWIGPCHGSYDMDAHVLGPIQDMDSPEENRCEKNWIPWKDMCIYKWYPFTVGRIEGPKLHIEYTQETPRFFKNLRGSSNVVSYNEKEYALVHIVTDDNGLRRYYHMMVQLNHKTVEGYTLPFYFTMGIEYCIGIDIRQGIVYAIVSQNDADPILVEMDLHEMEFISL